MQRDFKRYFLEKKSAPYMPSKSGNRLVQKERKKEKVRKTTQQRNKRKENKK